MTLFSLLIVSSAAFSVALLDSGGFTYTSREAPRATSAQSTFPGVLDGRFLVASLHLGLPGVRLRYLFLVLEFDRDKALQGWEIVGVEGVVLCRCPSAFLTRPPNDAGDLVPDSTLSTSAEAGTTAQTPYF